MAFGNMTEEQRATMRERLAAANELRHDVEALFDSAKLPFCGRQVEKVKHRLAQIPVSSRNRYLSAMKGRSQAAGIKAFCMECVGWERQAVRDCTDSACPLYPYRPYQDG